MGILDSVVEWLATQVMNLLDMINTSVLGALGCDMTVFLRYFPAAGTLYEVFVAFAIGFILLNLVWQLFKNFGVGIGSNNNLVRISHIKENEKATIKLEVCYENNIDYLENTDIWVFYR